VGIFRSIVITGGYRETGLASRRKQPRLFRPGDYFSIARDKYTFLAGESRIPSGGGRRSRLDSARDRTFSGVRRRDDDDDDDDDDRILPILAMTCFVNLHGKTCLAAASEIQPASRSGRR